LKERLDTQVVGILEVGIAGQDLIDFLGADRFGGVFGLRRRARIGQACGQVSDDAQGFFEGPNGKEAGIGDEAATGKGNMNRLRADAEQRRILLGLADHDLEPPHDAKLLVTHSLDSARGSSFKDQVRDPG
jgi:hypothetical protein